MSQWSFDTIINFTFTSDSFEGFCLITFPDLSLSLYLLACVGDCASFSSALHWLSLYFRFHSAIYIIKKMCSRWACSADTMSLALVSLNPKECTVECLFLIALVRSDVHHKKYILLLRWRRLKWVESLIICWVFLWLFLDRD